MIDQIERHIRAHSASWGLELPAAARLRALLWSNPEQDGKVHELATGQVGTLIFWFRPGHSGPFVVSKKVGPSLSVEAIAECARMQETANHSLGYDLFPRIHAIADIGGARIVFMEPAVGPNYEIGLARATCGPERSVKALQRVVSQLFQELGGALRGLQATSLSGTRVKWGAHAASCARRFVELCPEAGMIVSEARIAAMAEAIDTVALGTHPVLTEDHVANYLPGPRAVDQLVPDIRGLCAQWPGPVSGLRILVGFFRASPVGEAYLKYSWVDALAACLLDGDHVEIIGTPVRRFLADIGLGSASPPLAWAFVSGVFFMRACQELEFHADGPAATRLRGEFLDFARDVVRINDAVSGSGRDRDVAGSRALPRLNREHMEGEFRGRDEADFFSPQPRTLTELPAWVGPAMHFQRRFRERHGRLYEVLRRIFRFLADRIRQSPRL